MDPQLEEPDLRSYLGVIARRRWMVILTTLAFLGVALAFSLIPAPRYRVRAQVQTTGVADPMVLVFGNQDDTNMDRQAAAEIAYLNSSDIRFEVGRAYNGTLSDGEAFRVAARPVQGVNENVTSSVVELSLVSSEPKEAATLVNIYAKSYVRLRTTRLTERFITAGQTLEDSLDRVREEREEVRKPLTALETQVDANPTDAGRDSVARLRDDLAPQLDTLSSQQGTIQGRINDLAVAMDSSADGSADVISYAGVPDTPVSPKIPLNIAVGLTFGLFLGAALAFVRDYFDDSVKSKEVVDRVTAVPTLGLIPKVESGGELVTVSQPSGPAAEAFRSLRTAVKFLGIDRQVRVVQVTSPSPSEGKTFTAVNLAVALAQAGDRVVVVGADLRRPRLEQMLDVPLTPGLTGVLIGDVTLPQAIQSVPSVPNLSVLPAGQPPPNPSELLSGERARRLVDVLGQTYDSVVIDCPPVLPVTDSLVVARMVDTTLLVTSAHKTSKRALVRAVELLRQVDAPLAGNVLNSLSADDTFSSEPYRYDTVVHGSARRRRGDPGVGHRPSGPPGDGVDVGYPYPNDNGDDGRRMGRRGRGSNGAGSGEWSPVPGPPQS